MDQTKIAQHADNSSRKRGRPSILGTSKLWMIRIPNELAEQVEAYAHTWGISRSDAARRLIQEGLLR